jgi:hypothetical protein
MELAIVSVAVFLNFGLLLWKWNNDRHGDLIVDVCVLIALSYLFEGSQGGMVIALCAGAMMSVFLLFYKPKFSL